MKKLLFSMLILCSVHVAHAAGRTPIVPIPELPKDIQTSIDFPATKLRTTIGMRDDVRPVELVQVVRPLVRKKSVVQPKSIKSAKSVKASKRKPARGRQYRRR